jgi:hypothetical protein
VGELLGLTKVVLSAQRVLVAVVQLVQLVGIILAQMERQILEVVGAALRIKMAQQRHLGMVALVS